MTASVVLVAAVILFFVLWMLTNWTGFRGRKLCLPPGPPGWPIIKNLPVLFRDPGSTNDEYCYTRWTKEFGDIYKLELGPQLLYVLSNIDHIRKVFSHSKLQGRPPGAAYKLVLGPQAEGIVFSSGPMWKAMRQLTAKVFRDLGVGRGMFVEKISSETERLAATLDAHVESPCDIFDILSGAICNVLFGILFGHQFDYNDSEFMEGVALLKAYTKESGSGGAAMTSKVICGLPFGPGKALRGYLKHFQRFMKDKIEKARIAPGNNFVKAFWQEIENGEPYFNEMSLLVCIIEVFFAGTEAGTATIAFAIRFLISRPEVQMKCQEELDDFTRINGELPSYSDRSKLPFLQAVIQETERMAIVISLGGPHVVEEDLKLFGYDFPKGTVVVGNFGSVFMDETKFPEPRQFNPERFIKDGRFEMHEDIVPFAVGRRSCPGEALARMEIFLFLTSLLHRYHFSAPEDTTMPSILEGVYGATRTPPPFSVLISKRRI